MKSFLRLLPLLLFTFAAARASGEASVAAVRAADDERAAAMIAGERARLEAIFSEDLRYTHSSGSVDTKTSLIEALATNKSDYQSIDPEQRDVRIIAPGIALVSGRSRFKVLSNGDQLDLHLSHLSVYREENGRWRLVAWQSARLPSAASK